MPVFQDLQLRCKHLYTQAPCVSREVIRNDERKAPQVPVWINRLCWQRSTQDQDDGRPQNPPVQDVRSQVHAAESEAKPLSLGIK